MQNVEVEEEVLLWEALYTQDRQSIEDRFKLREKIEGKGGLSLYE